MILFENADQHTLGQQFFHQIGQVGKVGQDRVRVKGVHILIPWAEIDKDAGHAYGAGGAVVGQRIADQAGA